jgi:hypothetical protein
MPFGKHQGVPLADLPEGYLRWLGEPERQLREPLRSQVAAELSRRVEEHDHSEAPPEAVHDHGYSEPLMPSTSGAASAIRSAPRELRRIAQNVSRTCESQARALEGYAAQIEAPPTLPAPELPTRETGWEPTDEDVPF